VSPLRTLPAALFNLVFPDDCRVCGIALRNVSRIPVCPECLSAPAPFIAEHFCSVCRTPFLNSAPLDEQGRCGLCRRGLTGFDSAFSYGEYAGTLRTLIHVFKYGRVSPLSEPLGAGRVEADGNSGGERAPEAEANAAAGGIDKLGEADKRVRRFRDS
jgi:predicted amidophosphoribosyltransferase